MTLEELTMRRRLLQKRWWDEAADKLLTGDILLQLIELARRILPGPPESLVLQQSLAHLIGKVFDRETARSTAWRLVAGLRRLRIGEPVLPWLAQRTAERVTAQVVEVRLGSIRRPGVEAVPGCRVTLEIMTGTPASLRLLRVWSAAQARFLAKQCGFDRYRRRPVNWPAQRVFAPYRHFAQFYGLYVRLSLTRDSCEQGLDYQSVDCTESLRRRNKRQIYQQLRHHFTCPLGVDLPCYLCPAGRNVCPAATHERTYRQAKCARCLQVCYLDPQGDLCDLCLAHEPLDVVRRRSRP